MNSRTMQSLQLNLLWKTRSTN